MVKLAKPRMEGDIIDPQGVAQPLTPGTPAHTMATQMGFLKRPGVQKLPDGSAIHARRVVAEPFEKRIIENYVPHMFDWEQAQGDPARWANIVQSVRQNMGFKSHEAADAFLRGQVMRTPKLFRHVEYERLQNVGGYELNPLKWLPRYLYQSEYRLGFAKRFGVQGRDAARLLNAMRGEMNPGFVDDLQGILFQRPKGSYEVSDLVRRINGFQVVTKMGFGSTIANMSQSVNTMLKYGVTTFMKGAMRSFTDEGQKLGTLAYNRWVQDSLKQLMGVAEEGFASRFLNCMGFNWVERWNRFFAANTGLVALEDMAGQFQRGATQLGPRLKQMFGLTDQELLHLASPGAKPTRDMMDRAALIAAETTQHATQWHQLPMLWQNQWARVGLQFKNFAYNQTRFMFTEMFGPAFQWAKTGGREGTIKPLLRFVPLFVGAGEAVRHLRDAQRAAARAVLTGKWKSEEEWFWESDDWLAAAARDTLMVGSMGILGDLFVQAERRNVPGWLVGPTISDLGAVAERGTKFGKAVYSGREVEAKKAFAAFVNWGWQRAIPIVSPHIPSDVRVRP